LTPTPLTAIALNRRVYSDIAGAAPPLLIVLAFKFFVVRPLEKQFRYYLPTPEEAEAEFQASLSEKRTLHRDMEKRFLHPALQSNELFTVMVHKKQEALARDVLSAYPWFNKSRGDPQAIAIKAVTEVSKSEFACYGTSLNNMDFQTGSSGIQPQPRSSKRCGLGNRFYLVLSYA
jgi:hypothetical protein